MQHEHESIDDIHESERRLIQKELFLLEDQKEAAERRFQIMFENALVGLFRGEVDGRRLTDANLEAARIFGFVSVEELILHVNTDKDNYNFFETMPDPDQLSYGEPYSFSTKAIRLDGKMFWAQFSVRYSEDGRYIEGAVKDITDQVESMDRLRNAKAEADDANEAKSRFLATMSHEIRTPLNGVIGFAEILLEGNQGQNREYARKILDESDRLMILINQLLDFSRLEANKISLESILFDLHQVLDETESPLLAAIQQKKLIYTRELADDVPRWFIGDPMRLRQVLTNLLSNAVKFTESGGITLGLYSEPGNDTDLSLCISVADTGIGIPEDKIESIFSSFEQADTSISRKYGGTGLGISICRELVSLMGGELKVASHMEKGSRFYFTIPMTLPPAVMEGVPAVRSSRLSQLDVLSGLRILIVEDYDTNWEIARFHLENNGSRVFRAGNGREALVFLKENDTVDLIFMDLHMPEMDGLEATRILRALGYSMPVIGMTASAYADDKARCLGAGMDDFLTKPLRRVDLLAKAVSWANAEIPSAAGHTPAMTPGTTLRYTELLEEFPGEPALVAELLEGFIEDASRRLKEAENAFSSGDMVHLHREAHSIKGGALNLMADDLAASALVLEKTAGSSGVNSEELQLRLNELKNAFNRFRADWNSIRENNETD